MLHGFAIGKIINGKKIKATNTCCMDLIFRNLFFVNTNFYALKCQ